MTTRHCLPGLFASVERGEIWDLAADEADDGEDSDENAQPSMHYCSLRGPKRQRVRMNGGIAGVQTQ